MLVIPPESTHGSDICHGKFDADQIKPSNTLLRLLRTEIVSSQVLVSLAHVAVMDAQVSPIFILVVLTKLVLGFDWFVILIEVIGA